jgi:HPt (histidine-containing phosphotransfer) domain-containing protein
MNAGMDDYLSKPYGRLQMRDLLNRWVSQTEPTQARAEEPAGAAPATGVQVVDRNALYALRALQTNDKPDLLERVISLYLTESPKLIQRLKQAAAANDSPEIARVAHTLRSSSANLGAMGLTRLCQDLEASARLAATEKAGKLLVEVESEYGSVHLALAAELEVKAA